MRLMRTAWLVPLALVLTIGFAVGSWTTVNAADPDKSDAVKIATLVREMDSLTPAGLEKLDPLPIRRFELPPPGVDVMRARLTEIYSVDGVGRDEVELTGWIAVRHGNARPVEGATDLNWGTAVLTTEFVGMDLQGHSDVFGPVRVRLDETRRSIGAVGQIEIPAAARRQLAATEEPAPETTLEEEEAACEAAANVTVEMPELQLAMHTKSPVAWYSLVNTIPPVGHTASIAIEPVRLISAGREVGTLESGKVLFRELVRHERLSSARIEMAAR